MGFRCQIVLDEEDEEDEKCSIIQCAALLDPIIASLPDKRKTANLFRPKQIIY